MNQVTTPRETPTERLERQLAECHAACARAVRRAQDRQRLLERLDFDRLDSILARPGGR